MAKAELHLHLEGTVNRDTVRELDPSVTGAEVDAAWAYTDFPGFIECFKFVAQRLCSPEHYALITRRMIDHLIEQNVSYAEVTLAAGVVLWRGLDFDEVWKAIRTACEGSPVEIWWNLDAIRHFGPDHVMAVARLAAKHSGDGVISFGVGGDELRGPVREFSAPYKFAKDAGLRLTAHAGETDGPESVRAALDVGAERIGHGIRAVEDRSLVSRLREEQIPLEVCITSNVKTGAVPSLGMHPVRRLYDAGVPITLNTDDPGIFGCTLSGEFDLARKSLGFSDAELREIEKNAWRYRFGRTTDNLFREDRPECHTPDSQDVASR